MPANPNNFITKARHAMFRILSRTAITVATLLVMYSARPSHCASARDAGDAVDAAKAMVTRFMERLGSDRPFTKEEDDYFFGKWSGAEMILSHRMEEYAKRNNIPGFDVENAAPIGNLFRLHKNIWILPKDPGRCTDTYISAGTPSINISCANGKTVNIDNPGEIIVLHDQRQYLTKGAAVDAEELSQANHILTTFTYGIEQKKLMFPITVNGKSVLPLLGFYCNEKTGEPEIHPDILKYLIEGKEIPFQ